MARPVRDSIVLERAAMLNFDSIYLDNLSIYAGDVKTSLDKVKLEPTLFGMTELAITKRLSDKYESIKVSEGDNYISLEVTPGTYEKYSATVNQIRMLKALAIEQINANQDYSSVVTMLFYQLSRQIITGESLYEFPERTGLTKMQSVVYTEYGNYIRRKLSGAGDLVRA